jgi:hypothetical protein
MMKHLPKSVALVFVVAVFTASSLGSGKGQPVAREGQPRQPGPERDALRMILDDPAITGALLKRDAVVGVRGLLGKDDRVQSVGITCALCHSTVDDAFAPGIGHRLDGWPNRDLNIGKIIALAPTSSP